MGSIGSQLLLIAFLIVLNAVFAGTELALVSLREGQLRRLEKRSATGAVLARLARSPNRFLATIQIGITLAGFLASAAAAVSLSQPLEEPLSFMGDAARPASVVVVTLILSYCTLVFGELTPKRIAMQKAERWGLIMARPMDALSTLTRPAVWVLSKSTDIAVRLLGCDPNRNREAVTEDEIRDLVESHTRLTAHQRLIIDGAFQIARRSLGQIMVPRGDVFVLDAEMPALEALELLSRSGHTRAPVAEARDLDRVLGVIHMRQLLGQGNTPTSALVADNPVFPESAPVLTTLRDMQQMHAQMALVVSEHGGVEGIVTVEDLVEELVGEIYDETDRDLLGVKRQKDGTLLIPGRFPVHDLPDIGVEIPEGDYVTVAGFVLQRLGHIPKEGEKVSLDRWEIEVRSIRRHTIGEVVLRQTEATLPPEPEA